MSSGNNNPQLSVHRVHELADEVVRELLRRGCPADLVSAYARPLARAVVCEVAGVPRADRPRLNAWIDALTTTDCPQRTAEYRDLVTAYLTAVGGDQESLDALLVLHDRMSTRLTDAAGVLVNREQPDEPAGDDLVSAVVAAGTDSLNRLPRLRFTTPERPGAALRVQWDG